MVEWTPKTRLGKMVKSGKITTMSQALASGLPLLEPEIVDVLLPDLMDEVINVNMVQRMSDSGRRVRFTVMTVVGNGDGFIGIGSAKGKETGPTIRKAIDNAKLNIIEIKRGCGSWECGCRKPHTLPFKVKGKAGSCEVTLIPAPAGVRLAVGDVAKVVLRMAGIKDAWAITMGETRCTVNYASAVYNALLKTSMMKVTPAQAKELSIHQGPAAPAVPPIGLELSANNANTSAGNSGGNSAAPAAVSAAEHASRAGSGEGTSAPVNASAEASVKK